jgi:hypothetical protein
MMPDACDGDATRCAQVASWTKASLLVVGTLEIVTGVFQLVNIICVFLLRRLVTERWYRYRYRTHRPLKPYEAGVIAWALFTGLWSIFIDGTFVIFNKWLSIGHDSWFLLLYAWIGTADRRYTSSNPFIVTSLALMAVLIGPSCLFLAWAIYQRRPYRYLVGTCICSVLVYSQILFYSTEVQDGFRDIKASSSAFWVYFVIINVIKLVTPAVLLAFMLRKSQRKLEKLKNFEMVEVISRLAGEQRLGQGASALAKLAREGPPMPILMELPSSTLTNTSSTRTDVMGGGDPHSIHSHVLDLSNSITPVVTPTSRGLGAQEVVLGVGIESSPPRSRAATMLGSSPFRSRRSTTTTSESKQHGGDSAEGGGSPTGTGKGAEGPLETELAVVPSPPPRNRGSTTVSMLSSPLSPFRSKRSSVSTAGDAESPSAGGGSEIRPTSL